MLVDKSVVSEEVWFSDKSAPEFIELDADMVFLGINVPLGVKGCQYDMADGMQGDSGGVSPASTQPSE